MSVLDLNDALSSPDSSEEVTSGTVCCDTTMTQDFQECTLTLEDLVVSSGPDPFWRTVTVLQASNRIKKILACGGKDLKGNKLCSAILESIVKETIVETTKNFSTTAKRFRRADSETHCTLCDMTQKSIVLGSGGTRLHAVTLKAGHENHTAEFTLSRYDSNSSMDGQVVHLSISNYNLSCSMYQDRAMLIVEDLARISEDENLHRFLFCKTIEEPDRVRFESISCPGWFLSTVFDGDNMVVDMCKENAKRISYFIMN